jgi:hypothetical protein
MPARDGFAYNPTSREVEVNNTNVVVPPITVFDLNRTLPINGFAAVGSTMPGLPATTTLRVALNGVTFNGTPFNQEITALPIGTFSFPNVPLGSYTVRPFAPNVEFQPSAINVTLATFSLPAPINPSLRFLGFRVDQGFMVTGRVARESGVGIVGATVTIVGITSTGATIVRAINTVSNGQYSLLGIPDGFYTIVPQAAGFTFKPVSLIVAMNNANVLGQNFVGVPVSGAMLAAGAAPNGESEEMLHTIVAAAMPKTPETPFSMSVFPNPAAAASTLNISYELQQDEELEVVFQSQFGGIVHKTLSGLQAPGSHQMTLHVPSTLTSGTYFVSVRSSSGRVVGSRLVNVVR